VRPEVTPERKSDPEIARQAKSIPQTSQPHELMPGSKYVPAGDVETENCDDIVMYHM
jgi:hypothetical protein